MPKSTGANRSPASISFEAVQSIIAACAGKPVTRQLDITLPLEHWLDLERYAQATGSTIEDAIRYLLVSDEVLEASASAANSLMAAPTGVKRERLRRIPIELPFQVFKALTKRAHAAGVSLSEYVINMVKRDMDAAAAGKDALRPV